MNKQKYIIKLLFECGAGCLWGMNDAALRDFDVGPLDLEDYCPLPLSPELLRRCREMDEWHHTSLNWEYPPDPGPWRQPECDRFNAETERLLADIRAELGPDFEVIDRVIRAEEDPDLDRYLVDHPKAFRRDQP